MPRYINLDVIIAKLDADTEDPNEMFPIHWIKTFLNMQPTANVVANSEYYAVVSAVDNIKKEFLKLHDQYQEQKTEIERLERICNSYALQYGTVRDQQKVIDKAKDEVAKEIFEEIEKILDRNHFDTPFEYYAGYLSSPIRSLKKKYTEGESNG